MTIDGEGSTCGNCKYYYFGHDECRYGPPVAQMINYPDLPISALQVHAIFPKVRDDDWCYKFNRKRE